MDDLIHIIVLVMITIILGVVLVAVLSMPVAFAGMISAFGVGSVTAIVRYWPRKMD